MPILALISAFGPILSTLIPQLGTIFAPKGEVVPWGGGVPWGLSRVPWAQVGAQGCVVQAGAARLESQGPRCWSVAGVVVH